jgi:hypothetical protein
MVMVRVRHKEREWVRHEESVDIAAIANTMEWKPLMLSLRLCSSGN